MDLRTGPQNPFIVWQKKKKHVYSKEGFTVEEELTAFH